MKRLLFLTLLLAIASSRLSAQTGLNVAPLFTKFSGKGTPDVTSVTLRGSKVEPYQLSLFRSITFHTTGHTAEVERLVQADARTASYHESGTKSGHLYYGIYQFPIRDGRNRYLFYRNNTLSKKAEPTLPLIYMEGTATLETLKRTFSK